MNREEQKQTIKDYLKRLGAGEELESVRVDFVKKFQSVDAAEIMNAEQELIKEGTPISESNGRFYPGTEICKDGGACEDSGASTSHIYVGERSTCQND